MKRFCVFFVPFILFCAICANAPELQAQAKIRVLIISGQNNHAWRLTSPNLRKILEDTGRFDVRITEEPLGIGSEALANYDVVLLDYNGPRLGERFENALVEFLESGKGLALVHAANNAFNGWDLFDKIIGVAWRSGAYHPAFEKYEVTVVDRNHPITSGMRNFATTDEMYCNLTRHPQAEFTLLATAIAPTGEVKDKPQPMALVSHCGKGRVFHTPLGHVMSEDQLVSQKGAGFQALLRRGVEWAATGEVTIPLPDELKAFNFAQAHRFARQ